MPLKNRNLIIAGVSIVLLVGVVLYSYATFLYKPIRKDIQTTLASVKDLQQKLEQAKARAQQLSKIQEEMASLQVDVAALEKQLPKNRELPSLIRIVTHRAETYGVTLSSLAPGRAVSKGLYEEIPYNMTVSSSFHALGHFLTDMGKGERLFAARNLAVSPSGARVDPTKTINATFILVAFKYRE